MQAAEKIAAPGLLLIAARTGFTRAEILDRPLRKFTAMVRAFLPKDGTT